MKRFEIALCIGLLLSILLTSFGAFGAQTEEIRDNVVRLHILANSDSEQDQALKLAVRDALLEQTGELFLQAEDRLEAEALVEERLETIEAIARQEIAQQGYDYPVSAYLVNMFFETRHYGQTTLAAGRYDAVRVVIGEGEGQNWWCVMFPPMCLPAATEQEETPLEEQIQALNAQPHYVPKFAVVELVEGWRNRLAGEEDRVAAVGLEKEGIYQ